jgi:hypothetical protein
VGRQRRIPIRGTDAGLALARVGAADHRVDADAQLGPRAVARCPERVDVLDVQVAPHAARQRRPGAPGVGAGELPDEDAVAGGVAGPVVVGEDAVGISGLIAVSAAALTLSTGH